MENNLASLVGICGREGAGKTTISNHLCNNGHEKTFVYTRLPSALFYVLEVLFGWSYTDLVSNQKTNFVNMPRDVIWNLTVPEAIDKITTLFKTHIGENFQFIEFPFVAYDATSKVKGKYMECAFADALKKIASVMFEFPNVSQMDLHEILRGDIDETRKLREKIYTIDYDKCGIKTGRSCLEFLGTDVMRNHFDDAVWIKILQRDTLKYRKQGITIIVPDARFENEKDAIEFVDGFFIVVYRDEKDLVLTEADKKTHPAKWKFLEFLPNIKNLKKIHNNSTLEELYEKVQNAIH